MQAFQCAISMETFVDPTTTPCQREFSSISGCGDTGCTATVHATFSPLHGYILHQLPAAMGREPRESSTLPTLQASSLLRCPQSPRQHGLFLPWKWPLRGIRS